ncbi:DUF4283 domain-containing protein [Citrus sinensis]|nr:DUF4283 domain-containing protein [Citrus sinensis]
MSSEILSKEPPPPLVDDRSTKKARFREQGVDADNPPPLSFKDKLMEDQNELEEEILGREEDLEFEPEDVIVEDKNSIPSISFSGKIQAQLVKPWMNTIVVKLLERSTGYRALCNRLNDLWRTLQGFTVIDLENDLFLVRFKSEIDAQYALTQGPWTILGYYLTVQQWTPHFDSSNVNIENIVAWIRIPGMPLHYYHKRILRMIRNVVGKVIKIDYNTESARRGKFARIAVEISLNKPLCSQFFLDGKLQNIEYENLPIICFNCGIYGHKNDDCPQSNTLKNPMESCKNNVAEDNPNGSGEEKSTSSEVPVNPSFGPWMIVGRKGRGRVSKGGEESAREAATQKISTVSETAKVKGALVSKFSRMRKLKKEKLFSLETIMFPQPKMNNQLPTLNIKPKATLRPTPLCTNHESTMPSPNV